VPSAAPGSEALRAPARPCSKLAPSGPQLGSRIVVTVKISPHPDCALFREVRNVARTVFVAIEEARSAGNGA